MWHNAPMRLLFVADGRSPIAINWIQYFVERGDQVYLASTFACQPELDLDGLDITSVAFSGTKRPPSSAARPASSRILGLLAPLRVRTAIRHYLGPLTITRSAKKLRAVIERVMCDMAADLDVIARESGAPAHDWTPEMAALRQLEQDGLVDLDGATLRVRPEGRQLVRVVASVFDRYLDAADRPDGTPRHAIAV